MCSIAHDNLLVRMHMSVCRVCVEGGGGVRVYACVRACAIFFLLFSCVCVRDIYILDLMLLLYIICCGRF